MTKKTVVSSVVGVLLAGSLFSGGFVLGQGSTDDAPARSWWKELSEAQDQPGARSQRRAAELYAEAAGDAARTRYITQAALAARQSEQEDLTPLLVLIVEQNQRLIELQKKQNRRVPPTKAPTP